MFLTKTASPTRVMGEYLDKRCGPVPRVVVAANLKALKPNDWVTVYHGTTLSNVPQLINGFDAAKVKYRNYGGPRHKGLFVTPDFRTARRFASYGPTVLEMVVRAKNLHGTDYSGVTGRQDPQREEIWKDKYPDSFRPYLSQSLSQGSEPQALLQGLVAPRQIKRVWHAPKGDDKGQWYSRKEFLELGIDPSANPRDKQPILRDLGFDKSHPNYDYDEFIDAMVSFLGEKKTRSRIEKTLALMADISMVPGRSDTLAETIEMDGMGFEPRAAQRYADRFREQLAALSQRRVAASVSRVVSRFALHKSEWAKKNHAQYKRVMKASKTYFHGTRLDDALSIEKRGYRINRAAGRGRIFGPGFYMTADRSFAEGYAKDVLYDDGLDAALLHLKINPRKPLPLDPKEWPDDVRDLYVRWNGDVPAQKNRVDWWDVGTIARKFGYDAVVDNGGDYAVVFNPSVVRVVKVEPMMRAA